MAQAAEPCEAGDRLEAGTSKKALEVLPFARAAR